LNGRKCCVSLTSGKKRAALKRAEEYIGLLHT